MKRAPRALGFTIVETMIVLAVTGVLFLAVSTSISGRQNRYEYLTGSQDIRDRLQQMLNDVQNGYFPQDNQFSCSKLASGLQFGTSGTQGKNPDCIFLGKAMQFQVGSQNADPETVAVATVAGNSSATGSPTDASVAPTVALALTTDFTLGADLQTSSITVPGVGTGYNGVAFLTDAGSTASGGQLLSGRQAVHAYAVRGSFGDRRSFNAPSTPGSPDLGVPLSGKLTAPGPGGIQICFQSLGTKNYAIVTIGANGSATDITLNTRTSC